MTKSLSQMLQEVAATGSPMPRLRRRRRRGSSAARRKINKHWTWGPEEINAPIMTTSPDNLFIGLSDISDHTLTSLIKGQMERGIDTHIDDFSILCTSDQWNKYVRSLKDVQLVQFKGRSGMVIDHNKNWFLDYNINSGAVEIQLYGQKTAIGAVGKELRDLYEEVLTEIEWIYAPDGSSMQIPLRADRHPVSEMYPFLGDETLEEYYERYMNSPASILLLIGPPGTGKTSFIRGLMQHTQSSATVTYDENILAKDYVFANFIEGDKNLMVIEDADMFLKARSEGNATMHKFLNVGDGLVTTRNKKLIFSTNLPSIRDIDPALIRPGRCFDIVTFDLLTQEQAEKLAAKMNVVLTETKDKWNIADIFNKQTFDVQTPIRRGSMGFL